MMIDGDDPHPGRRSEASIEGDDLQWPDASPADLHANLR